jgi:hypothetical protein
MPGLVPGISIEGLRLSNRDGRDNPRRLGIGGSPGHDGEVFQREAKAL